MRIRNKQARGLRGLIFSQTSFFILGILVIGMLAWPLFNNLFKQNELNKEVRDLEKEIEKLSGDNEKLSELLDFLGSDEFVEEQARLNLNYKKADEDVVVITSGEDADGLQNSKNLNNSNNLASLGAVAGSNPGRWWQYFFRGINSRE
jgi:cell division protein FtsB